MFHKLKKQQVAKDKKINQKHNKKKALAKKDEKPEPFYTLLNLLQFTVLLYPILMQYYTNSHHLIVVVIIIEFVLFIILFYE